MTMDRLEARSALVERLRTAYAGELAAARAYAGHWRSVRDPQQRRRIQEILQEDLDHRERIGQMLAELGARPTRRRDLAFTLIGRAIAASCFVGGWLVPMVGAGRIEARNIREYEDAARRAVAAGLDAWADEFLGMAEVKWDHERFFHDLVRGHRLGARLDWPAPPPRSEIRASFARELPPVELLVVQKR